MKKKTGKLIAMVMAAVMMLSTGLPVYAKEGSAGSVEELIAAGAVIGLDASGNFAVYYTASPVYGPDYQFGDVPVSVVIPGALTSGLTNAQIRSTLIPSQITPGGVVVYGWDCTDMINGTVIEWPAVYLNAIDEAGITNEMSDYDKCVAINNYLCNKIRYDLEGWKGRPDGLEYKLLASGALEPGRYGEMSLHYGIGVCYNYADAFLNMAGMLGIPCNKVVSKSLKHAWNEVYIDGVAYHIDVTWNDMDAGVPVPNQYLMSTQRWDDHQSFDLAYEWGDSSLLR